MDIRSDFGETEQFHPEQPKVKGKIYKPGRLKVKEM